MTKPIANRRVVNVVDRRNRWHFDKKMSLDTLVAIAGIAVVIGGPLMLAWRSMENRVVVLETKQEAQQSAEMRRDSDAREQRIAVLSQMKDLGDGITKMQISFAKLEAQIGAATTAAATAAASANAVAASRK